MQSSTNWANKPSSAGSPPLLRLQKLYLPEIWDEYSKVIFSRPVVGPVAWVNTLPSVSTFFHHLFVVTVSITRIWADTIRIKKCTNFDILAGIILLWQLFYSQVFCVCRKRLVGENNIFILLKNYFSCIHNYLSLIPLMVLSLMKGALYVIISAAKGCIVSVSQISNWNHPGLCLHCFGPKRCSPLTLYAS